MYKVISEPVSDKETGSCGAVGSKKLAGLLTLEPNCPSPTLNSGLIAR